MFHDFIKHYNIIRTILRDVFLYGCFSREGLEDKRKISSRKISYEIRRIQQYVEEEFIRTDRDGRYKLLSLTYDSIRNTENFLVKTYMTKSFTRMDMVLYFYILMILNSKDRSLCFKDIESCLIEKGLISYDNISSKTIERKLDEMYSSLGVLNCEVIKRTKYYSLAPDIFKNLKQHALEELVMAVSMFKNIVFPITSGYFCESSLKDYMSYERKLKYSDKDCFQYKNLHFHPVIEEQILWKILNAIHQRKMISLNYKLPPTKRKGEENQLLKPLKIRYDIQCGRFYLVSYDDKNKAVISRLDRIEEVKIYKDTYEVNNLNELYERDMKYSWSSVPLGAGNRTEHIKLEIIINEPKENYIIDKIRSEVKEAVVDKIEEGRYILSMFVNDSGEMLPWIRSYSGYIKVIKGRNISRRLAEDWKEMLEAYGTL
jgi:predicted DNA-binding transcriptional regulator YafY